MTELSSLNDPLSRQNFIIRMLANNYYTVSQLNWYPFCFANTFVNFKNNSMKFYKSLKW